MATNCAAYLQRLHRREGVRVLERLGLNERC
jgi:hypothetical protein